MYNEKILPSPPGPAAHPKVGIAVLCFIIDIKLEDQVEKPSILSNYKRYKAYNLVYILYIYISNV